MPLVITNESSSDPAFRAFARIGTITKIRHDNSEYHIEYALDSNIPPIANDGPNNSGKTSATAIFSCSLGGRDFKIQDFSVARMADFDAFIANGDASRLPI